MKQVRSITAIVLAVCLILSLGLTQAFAAAIETDRDVAIHIHYQDTKNFGTEKPAIPGAVFRMYRVADVDENGNRTALPDYALYADMLEDPAWESWDEMAGTLSNFVLTQQKKADLSGTTDENGDLDFTVKPGLYLVQNPGSAEANGYRYTTRDFMAFFPGQDEGGLWSYDVPVLPKEEGEKIPDVPPEKIRCVVVKDWDDEGFETLRPESITVTLYAEDESLGEKTLNDESGWMATWEDLDADIGTLYVAETGAEDYTPYYPAHEVIDGGVKITIRNQYQPPEHPEEEAIVQKKIVGSIPKNPSEFAFVMRAKDLRNPMPEGSKDGIKEIQLQGAGSVSFGKISFEAPGTYSYLITEKNTAVKGYTYDSTIYTLTYEVTETDDQLTVTGDIVDQDGESVKELVFSNTYKPDEVIPKTGLTWWPVPALLALGIVFVCVGVTRRRKAQ